MAENKIAYSSRNYDDYKKGILDITAKYYNDVYDNLNDASVGSWFVDVLADIADNLSYNIDKAYQETSIDSANETKSLLNLARSNGCKIPGKKAAIVEIELSCVLPLNVQGSESTGDVSEPDEHYAPYIRRGSLFSNGLQSFELMNDVDFSKQFDENGVSNRQILPLRNSNGTIIGYRYAKLAIAMSGQSKIYKKMITASDIKPFMEILINDTDILGVESVIVKQGTNRDTDPSIDEFYVDREEFYDKNGDLTQRYFEVENLIEQYRFETETEETDQQSIIDMKSNNTLDVHQHYYNPIMEVSDVAVDATGKVTPLRYVSKGKWKRFKNKFVTEYTDKWALKLTFGKGIRNEYGQIPTEASSLTQYIMSRMEANDYMGVLPEENSTMYILYRTGGGVESNIGKGALTSIVFRNMTVAGNSEDPNNALKIRRVFDTLSVTNTTPSYGGKDEPSAEELKYLIKYNNAAQNRCVTLHDYYARIMQIPAKFGCPFRCGVIEENNKVVIYTLGLDENGNLRSALAEQVAENMKNYLSKYRMINDFVEIRSGRIINVAFEVDIFVDKSYDKNEVVKRVIDLIYDYMDINKHQMGEDIFIGDLEKELSKLDGVQNLIDLRVYNRVGSSYGYSDSEISQEFATLNECSGIFGDYSTDGTEARQIDLKNSDKVLFTEANSMFEIKYKSKDIKVTVKQRQ